MALPQELSYTEEDYYILPESVRAELIYGSIYNQAAPNRQHQEILGYLYNKISNYIAANKGLCKVYPSPFAVKLFNDKHTIVEPDISVICDRNKLTDKGCSGAPDWIIEIVSPSNSSHDYVRKLNLYMDAGVKDYWIVNPMDKTIYVYNLEESQFQVVSYSFSDEIKSNTLDNFSVNLGDIDIE